jgi:hypothetical protein
MTTKSVATLYMNLRVQLLLFRNVFLKWNTRSKRSNRHRSTLMSWSEETTLAMTLTSKLLRTNQKLISRKNSHFQIVTKAAVLADLATLRKKKRRIKSKRSNPSLLRKEQKRISKRSLLRRAKNRDHHLRHLLPTLLITQRR